jgi:hypothetical protein
MKRRAATVENARHAFRQGPENMCQYADRQTQNRFGFMIYRIAFIALLVLGTLAASPRQAKAFIPPPAGTSVGAGIYVAGGIIGIAAIVTDLNAQTWPAAAYVRPGLTLIIHPLGRPS